jgi:2-polyprenyl-3-methyl-5-hydroxy-6-metoxy-1,4-benzoquinol methylase
LALTTPSVPTAADTWDHDLETLGACPVCGAPERARMFSDLRDVVFDVAPGRWTMFRCGRCRAGYLDPRPTRDSVAIAYEDYYTHVAGNHNSLFEDRGPVARLRNDYLASRFGYALPKRNVLGRWIMHAFPMRRRRYDRLIRGLPRPGPSGRLLDVGCGDGEFLLRMRELGWQVVGQEIDPRAAAATRQRGIDVVEGPFERAGFEGRFDVVTSSHVLEHVHDPVEFFATCRDLLVPGGRLWIATPNIDSIGFRRFGPNWRGLECPRHLILFSRSALALALGRAGFRHADVRGTIGLYGSLATSVALDRRVRGAPRPGQLRVYAENLIGDALMLAAPGLGEELVAVARH